MKFFCFKEFFVYFNKESLLAWTQDAYYPLHSKCMLCCSTWGYPPLTWDLTWMGVGVPPSCIWGEYPADGGTPSQVRTWGGYLYPRLGRGGTPTCWQGWGHPPVWNWDLARAHPPPPRVDRHTEACQDITFPRTPYAGGNNMARMDDGCHL